MRASTYFRSFATTISLACLALSACGPMVEQAPFAYRPDTTSPGDLLGPFDGIVVDAETDRPIPGALVAGSWAFERGIGLNGPAGANEVTLETGPDGRYRIPALDSLPGGPSARVRRFTLIVYHQGYIGWRSDRQFPEGNARRDFSQRNNRVRLEKWREGLLHNRHLVFLGGGAATRSAAQGEVQAAVMELEGRRPVPTPGAPEGPAAPPRKQVLDATPLLSEDELRGVTGYAGEFDLGRLKDLPTTDFYDSRHFKARGQAESWDVAVRVWRMGPAAEAQYRKLLGQLPGARVTDELGDSSLRARAAEVLGVAFLSREKGVVVSVSCGIRQCPEPAIVVRLAKLIESHLGELESTAVEDLEESGVKSLTPATPAAPPPAPAPGGASPPATPPTENPQQ
jgi:hypothetical protein